MKKSLLVCLLVVIVTVSVTLPIQAGTTNITVTNPGFEHTCDAPDTRAQGVHSEHGSYNCGNVDTNNTTGPEHCTDTSRSNTGALLWSEALDCGPSSGPFGSAGCTWQTVAKCPNVPPPGYVSQTFSIASDTDGTYPNCMAEALSNGDGHGRQYTCSNSSFGDSHRGCP